MKEEYKCTNYPSDLTDRHWEKIEEFFPSGNKSKYHNRNLVEAVMRTSSYSGKKKKHTF
jgi:hypothetical protein